VVEGNQILSVNSGYQNPGTNDQAIDPPKKCHSHARLYGHAHVHHEEEN